MNKKLLFKIIIFILFLNLFTFNINCFASEFEYNGNIISLPDIPNNSEHYLVLNRFGSYLLIVLDNVYNDNAYVVRNSEGGYLYSTDNVSAGKESNINRIPFYYYGFDSNSFSWVLQTSNSQWTASSCDIVYSTEDVYFKGELVYEGTFSNKQFYCFPDKQNVTLENFKYSQILSAAYSSENYNNYTAQISLNGEEWTIMNKEYEALDNSTFIFYCDVFENGTYQVKVFDNNTGLYVYDDVVEVDNIPFSITLEPSEDTDEPIIARTNTFSFNASLKYSVHFSTDKEEWTRLNHSTEAPSETEEVNADDTYYWTRIFKNGTYYFRFTYYDEEYDENGKLISSTPNYFYVTKKIKNLMVEDYMSDDYIFKPIISLSFNEETQAFVVRTQSILLDKALNLNCFYITYEKTEGFNPNEQIEDSVITGWNKMEIDFENNIYMGTSDAYFYFEIPVINATDTNYKIAFYNYISEKSSEIVYYDFVYEDAKDYVENDLKAHLGINVRLNDFLKNIESHLGILGFPMAIVRNFCNKILTLQAKEPIISIPELYEPFYHNKIYNGTSFNFNSLLVNDSVIFIHEFYLTIVDIIFIYLFLVYCVKTLKTFISNITNDD